MLLENSIIKNDCLKNETILITGAGGGIGFETARSLVWMGANVIIAEINSEKGKAAEDKINNEFNTTRADFYQIDISKEEQIDKLFLYIKEKYGGLDVIFNNAIIIRLGAIDQVSMKDWDLSYEVNLRAPILLIQKFLPDMKARKKGTIVFVPSSGAAPYMGAYEIFKSAQVELCNTLIGEIENTNINTYSIGPGLVKTETAKNSIEQVSRLMNISIEEFYAMNEKHMLDVELAGAGFAISVAFASKYNGQEIASIQALMDVNIIEQDNDFSKNTFSKETQETLKTLILEVVKTFHEQYQGWIKRNVFERQWIYRDFKKEVKLSTEEFNHELELIKNHIDQGDFNSLSAKKHLFMSLQKYYEHQYKLLQGYEKSLTKLKENSQILINWIEDIKKIVNLL